MSIYVSYSSINELNLKREYLKLVKIINYSGSKINISKIPILKKHQYFVVPDFSITGDAPKEFIRAYEYGEVKKNNYNKWSLFIAKTGHKWYPAESITEYLLNKLGVVFGLNMAKSNIVLAGGQIRFLSKYFIKEEEELIHGADIFAGYMNDKPFIEEIETQNLSRDFFTVQFAKSAIKFAYPYHFEEIIKEFVKMLIFDAIVGNYDRHFYNWGIIRHIERDHKPFFSPIYDTARGLFWNFSDSKINDIYKDKKLLKTKVENYCEKSRPKIGWDRENDINHFKLFEKIYNNEFGISKNEIKQLLLRKNFGGFIDLIKKDFVYLLSSERIEIIIECLNYRYNRINEILER